MFSVVCACRSVCPHGARGLYVTITHDTLNLGGTHPTGMISCFYHSQMKLWEGSVFTPVCQLFCPRGLGRV